MLSCPLFLRLSHASLQACLVSLEKHGLVWAVSPLPTSPKSWRWAGWGQMWTHQTLPSGYPNEAAAEIVLATLREWLEQHKDKVRLERSVGSEAGAGVPSAELVWRAGSCPPPAYSLGQACLL